MNYSKMTTQFETQAMAYSRLRAALPFPEFLVRGYDGHLKVFRATSDDRNPTLLLTIYVKESKSADEVGFFKQKESTYLLVGRDTAWKSPDLVKEVVRAI
jgi:hypothetical protein